MPRSRNLPHCRYEGNAILVTLDLDPPRISKPRVHIPTGMGI